MVLKVEFTVEPFVPGNPGPHVEGALQVLRDSGIDPDMGPFGTSFDVEEESADVVIGHLVVVAFSKGAERLSLQVER